MYEQELNDVPKAIATLRKLLEVEFDNKPAVLALDRLYSATAAWPDLVDILAEILRRRIEVVQDTDDQLENIHSRRETWKKLFETYEKLIDTADTDTEMADIYARMARISSDALNEEDKAIELLSSVLDIRGEEPQALSGLADLTTRRQKWDELVESA